MTITLRGTSSISPSAVLSTSSPISLSLPPGTTVGDVSIIYCVPNTVLTTMTSLAGNAETIAISGWTSVANFPGNVAFCFYRVFQSGDPSSINITLTASNYIYKWKVVCISYIGVDNSFPIDNVCPFTSMVPGSYVSLVGLSSPVVPNYTTDKLVVFNSNYSSSTKNQNSFAEPSSDYDFVYLSDQNTKLGAAAVIVFDKTLSNTNSTGYITATSTTSLASSAEGLQITLKDQTTSTGAVTTQPFPVVVGQIALADGLTIPIVELGLLPGDMIVIFIFANGAISAPSGYSKIGTDPGVAIYTHTYAAGDANATFALSSGSNNSGVYILRNSSSSGSVVVDQSQFVTGTGPLTLSSMTPSGTNEVLLCVTSVSSQGSLTGWNSTYVPSFTAGLSAAYPSAGGYPSYTSGGTPAYGSYAFLTTVSSATGTITATMGVGAPYSTMTAIAVLFKVTVPAHSSTKSSLFIVT